jgi:ribose transport system ATP-binding protein
MNIDPEPTSAHMMPSLADTGEPCNSLEMPRLEIRSLTGAWGVQKGCENLPLRVQACEFHALTGLSPMENSVLARQFTGLSPHVTPCFWVDGLPFTPNNPQDALKARVSTLLSEPQLIPSLTVAETLMLVAEPRPARWCDLEIQTGLVKMAREALGIPLSPESLTGNLSPLEKRLVELAGVFLLKPKLLVLESVADGLPDGSLELLFQTIRVVSASGTAVLYLGGEDFRLRERFDNTTALRKRMGVNALHAGYPDLPANPSSFPPVYPRISHFIGKPLFELDEVQINPNGPTLKMGLRQGEIFGLVAAPNSGAGNILRCIAGVLPYFKGEMVMRGKVLGRRDNPCKRLSAGIGMLGAPLGNEAVLSSASIADNLILGGIGCLNPWQTFFAEERGRFCVDWMQKLHIYARSPREPMMKLPPVAQRKVALARLICLSTKLLILEQMTDGLRPREKASIHQLLGEWASEGISILMSGNDLPEMLGICDTIGIVREGDLMETRPASEWTEPEIIAVMTATHSLPGANNPSEERSHTRV